MTAPESAASVQWDRLVALDTLEAGTEFLTPGGRIGSVRAVDAAGQRTISIPSLDYEGRVRGSLRVQPTSKAAA